MSWLEVVKSDIKKIARTCVENNRSFLKTFWWKAFGFHCYKASLTFFWSTLISSPFTFVFYCHCCVAEKPLQMQDLDLHHLRLCDHHGDELSLRCVLSGRLEHWQYHIHDGNCASHLLPLGRLGIQAGAGEGTGAARVGSCGCDGKQSLNRITYIVIVTDIFY